MELLIHSPQNTVPQGGQALMGMAVYTYLDFQIFTYGISLFTLQSYYS